MRERQVREDAERLPRPGEAASVGRRDRHARESPGEPPGVSSVQLDGDDPPGAPDELARHHAMTRTDLDDEIAACDAGVTDEVSGEARRQEVTARRA